MHWSRYIRFKWHPSRISIFQPKFAPVVSFLHRVPGRREQFYKIDFSEGYSTGSIKLTGNHFIYITSCSSNDRRRIYASEVRTGDCLLRIADGQTLIAPVPVVNVTKVWETGIYSPLTSTGVSNTCRHYVNILYCASLMRDQLYASYAI